jgi:hypothetical protein
MPVALGVYQQRLHAAGTDIYAKKVFHSSLQPKSISKQDYRIPNPAA